MDKRFEQVYSENSRYVYSVVLGIMRNKNDAEDIMQEVFIKLFNSYNSFRGDCNIKTYLYRMAVNKAIDLIRYRKLTNDKYEYLQYTTNEKNTHQQVELDALLSKIPEVFRIPLLLSEISGFRYREIAEILDINIGTVKSRVHRGMKILKKNYYKEMNIKPITRQGTCK